jgi:hypothetical protein
MAKSERKILTVADAVRETLHERMEAASKTLGKAVRPIYRVKNGKPDHLGTCIFLKRAGQHLLLTAAHVTDQSKSYDLHVAVGTKLIPLKGLYGAMSTPPEGDRDKDKYDFAVLTLPPNLVDTLRPLKYLEGTEVNLDPIDPVGRAYMAFGYPNSRNKKIRHDKRTIRNEVLSYGATALRDDTLVEKLGITGEDHFFIAYDERCRDPAGSIVDSVKPRGMSGGALIDLGRISPFSLASQVHSFGLAGLLIENHKGNRRIVAVRIGAIFGALERGAQKMQP